MGEREWKQALFAYVNQYNRSEVNGVPQPDEYLEVGQRMERAARAARLEQWYNERDAVPLRSETRAKPLRMVQDTPDEAVVDVQLHVRLFYEKGGMTHREDRIERERLTFTREGEAWQIARIERDPAERKPAGGEVPFEQASFNQGGNLPLLNRGVLGFGSSARPSRYRREEAAAYADQWWDSFNPEFEGFDVDCTNYISQCLFAGGAPIHYTGKRESGWWYKGRVAGRELWSYSWAVSNSLERYLGSSSWGLTAEQVSRPEQLMLGDVIFYDWDGDGTFQHSTVVTAFDAGGMPLVNAHTVSSRHRYWDYKNSYAWTDNTVYRFYHIADYF
ncbi:hypothetical protein GMA19_00721 [Paenibacillus polymyxa E681]|uniref:amidase domain-containing protein n=1 Tax=Paenibacillus polymyxa TaxID=1406 RepID=UPI0001E314BD|nr:amidase domain-containing protein [Paenibacillus polymyxa]ADM68569.1 hypothetical protein PPE_00715 [Paenibacillus polymyxa E681]QNV55572.1 hypothetical protein GE561_00722 [Paenibacillus polymyxa E681]QNV60408.1 hypothetical protein GMA19_00721 [Paenibacillus polymyxa E681]